MSPNMLSPEQVDAFWRDGVVVAEDAVTPEQLAAFEARRSKHE